MADNSTRILISAEDKTGTAIASAQAGLARLQSSALSISSALGGIGAGISLGGLAAMVKSSIDAADAMNDLSQRVGISVADLAKYELAAKQSGTSMESIARGVKSLAGNMLEHSIALKAAGVSARDADGAMVQLADLFASMPDGIDKTTLATKLFGKAGMDLIPMLNMGSQGLVEAGEKSAKYAAALAALAPQADKFNDSLAELSISARVGGLVLAETMMPALQSIAGAMALAAQEGGTLRALWIGFGGIADSVIKPFSNTVKGLSAEVHDFIAIVEGARAKITFGDVSFQASKNALAAAAAAASIRRELLAQSIPSAGIAGAASKDVDAELLERIKKLKAALGLGESAKADPYAALIKSIREKTAVLQADAVAEEKQTEAQKLALKIMVDLRDGTLKLTAAKKTALSTDLESLLAADALASAAETARKAEEEHRKEQAKRLQDSAKAVDTLQEQVEKQRRHNEEIGLTAEELARLSDVRDAEDIAAKRQELAYAELHATGAAEIELIRDQIEAMEQLRGLRASGAARQVAADAAKQAADDWKKFSEQIEQSLTDALMRGFENGNSFSENFVKTLQNTLKTAALKVVVQAMVNPVMSGLQGMVGGSGSSGGFNLPMGGGGGIYDAFATSSLGADLGLSVPGMMGPTLTGEALSGMTALGSGIGAALPWIGGAMALASLGGLFEGDGLAQRTGQFVSPFAQSNAMGASQYGAMPDGSRYNWANNHWFSGDMAPGQDQFDAALQEAEQSIVKKLGLSAAQIAAIDAQIAGLDGKVYNFGTEHTDAAASGVFEAIKADRMQAIATGLGMTLQDLTDQMSGAAKTAKELAAETEKLATEQNKAKAQALLAGMSATLSALDSVTGLRSGIMASMTGIQGGNTYDSRMSGLQALLAGETDISRQIDLAGQIKDLVLERYQAERDAITTNQAAAEEASNALRAGLVSVGVYARSLLVSNLSPLTAGQRLSESAAQYEEALSKARRGDLSGVSSLSGAAGTYLEQARGYYASSGQYSDVFGSVQNALAQLGLSADSVTSTADWQAQLLKVDNDAVARLDNLANFTEDWTLNLETLLVDQTREFEALGLKLTDVADNTRSLDSRIAVLVDTALGARFDKLVAAVEKSAATTARAVTAAVQVTVRA